MMWVSMYPPQWQNTTLRHSGLPNWPTLQGLCAPTSNMLCKPQDQVPHTLQDTSATPHRAQVITDFLLHTLQIWLPSIFGQGVAKNYPTLVDVYQLTRVLQQVWQSKLFRPSSSPRVSAAQNVFHIMVAIPAQNVFQIMAAIPTVDCHELELHL